MALDDEVEARNIIGTFPGDPAGLAQHIAGIVLTRTSVVVEVFRLLDPFYKLNVGGMFMQKITFGQLQTVARTSSGMVLCKSLLKFYSVRWSDQVNVETACPQWNPAALRQFLQAAIRMAGRELEQTDVKRKLSNDEIEYYAAYNKTDDATWEHKKSGWYHAARSTYDPTICWELPASGRGFVTYNRDDLKASESKLHDRYGYDQIGTEETIDRMLCIAAEWASDSTHSRNLEYGDVSRPGGVNTPDHATHNNGKAFDIRPMRKSGSGGFDYTQTSVYDQNLTKDFILLVVRLYPGTTFYFNDSGLNTTDKATRDYVSPSSGHNNHLHVMFPGGN